MGEDATDPVAETEDEMGTGIGPRDEEPERGIYIGESDVWFSRSNETDGETARRLEEVGYGSKRSSYFRLLVRTAEEEAVGGGVYLH